MKQKKRKKKNVLNVPEIFHNCFYFYTWRSMQAVSSKTHVLCISLQNYDSEWIYSDVFKVFEPLNFKILIL